MSNIAVKRIIFRIMILMGIWLLFTGWSFWSWVVGIPVVIAALTAYRFLPEIPAFNMHLVGAVYFLIYFVKQSFFGGIDVAWRAFHPRCPLSPGLIRHDVQLTNDFAVVVFANTISLLPGTLSVGLQGKQVTVHALDRSNEIRKSLSLLEFRVAKLFGEEWTGG